MGVCQSSKKNIPMEEKTNKIKISENQISDVGNNNQNINQNNNHNQNDNQNEENESNRWDDELDLPKTAPPTLIVQNKKV